MLERTARKIESYYSGQKQIGSDGLLHEIDTDTRIDLAQGELLASLHRTIRPDLSLEIGLAYAYSALFILDAMEQDGYGSHIAIDPFQMQDWHGIGCTAIRDLDFGERFTWTEARSDRALPKLIDQGARAQFVFIDGFHTFDACLMDFLLSDQLLDTGGIIIIDDMWMPSIQTVASFILTNMKNYKQISQNHHNILAVQKIGNDDRPWDHFVSFETTFIDKSSVAPRGRKGFFDRFW